MSKIESQRVLCTASGQSFKVGDVVTVIRHGIDIADLTGRIDFIDTCRFILDMSERFKSCTVELKLDDILEIKAASSEAIFDPLRVNMVEVFAAIGVPVTRSQTDMHRRTPEQIGRDVWSALDALECGIRLAAVEVLQK